MFTCILFSVETVWVFLSWSLIYVFGGENYIQFYFYTNDSFQYLATIYLLGVTSPQWNSFLVWILSLKNFLFLFSLDQRSQFDDVIWFETFRTRSTKRVQCIYMEEVIFHQAYRTWIGYYYYKSYYTDGILCSMKELINTGQIILHKTFKIRICRC